MFFRLQNYEKNIIIKASTQLFAKKKEILNTISRHFQSINMETFLFQNK